MREHTEDGIPTSSSHAAISRAAAFFAAAFFDNAILETVTVGSITDTFGLLVCTSGIVQPVFRVFFGAET